MNYEEYLDMVKMLVNWSKTSLSHKTPMVYSNNGNLIKVGNYAWEYLCNGSHQKYFFPHHFMVELDQEVVDALRNGTMDQLYEVGFDFHYHLEYMGEETGVDISELESLYEPSLLKKMGEISSRYRSLHSFKSDNPVDVWHEYDLKDEKIKWMDTIIHLNDHTGTIPRSDRWYAFNEYEKERLIEDSVYQEFQKTLDYHVKNPSEDNPHPLFSDKYNRIINIPNTFDFFDPYSYVRPWKTDLEIDSVVESWLILSINRTIIHTSDDKEVLKNIQFYYNNAFRPFYQDYVNIQEFGNNILATIQIPILFISNVSWRDNKRWVDVNHKEHIDGHLKSS